MQTPDTCAVIRKLNTPNKFGETYRIDFHRYRNETIKELISNYEIDSVERAYSMLRGDTWVRDHYDIIKILEMEEDEVIPGHEIPVLESLNPTHHVYQLDIKQFEGYLNHWLQNEKGVHVTIEVDGESDGGYGHFGFTIPNETHLEVLASLYDIQHYVEYEIVQPIMYDVFQSEKISYEYDVKRECLMVYKPID